jgi:hypothetical protein
VDFSLREDQQAICEEENCHEQEMFAFHVGPHIPSTVVSSYKVQPICRAKVGLNAPEIEDLRISEAPYGARLSDNCSQVSSWVQSSVAIYSKELSVYK